MSRIKNFHTLNDSAHTKSSLTEKTSQVICTAEAIILTCVSVQMKTSKDSENNIFTDLFSYFHNPVFYIAIGQQKLHTYIHHYHRYIEKHHNLNLCSTQAKQLFSILHFLFFYSSVPNESSLHSFAAPGKVPQAAILGVGGEKVVSRTERIIRSIFLQLQAAMTCKSLT